MEVNFWSDLVQRAAAALQVRPLMLSNEGAVAEASEATCTCRSLLLQEYMNIIIGASVSEPLSSDLSVNFICLSVCHGLSTYRKSLPALILCVCVMH